MKPNKALQGTQPVQSTNTTQQHVKSPQEKGQGLCERDNPLPSKSVLLAFIDVYKRCISIERELKIKSASVQMLLLMIELYKTTGSPISQYTLAKRCTNLHSNVCVYQRCVRMVRLGIIECVGISKYKSPVYLPTRYALEVIQRYFTVVEVEYLLSTAYAYPNVA